MVDTLLNNYQAEFRVKSPFSGQETEDVFNLDYRNTVEPDIHVQKGYVTETVVDLRFIGRLYNKDQEKSIELFNKASFTNIKYKRMCNLEFVPRMIFIEDPHTLYNSTKPFS